MLPVPPDDEPEPTVEAPAPRDTGRDYILLEGNSREALEEVVNTHLRRGWRLQGGVAVATHGALHWWYYQAVVGP